MAGRWSRGRWCEVSPARRQLRPALQPFGQNNERQRLGEGQADLAQPRSADQRELERQAGNHHHQALAGTSGAAHQQLGPAQRDDGKFGVDPSPVHLRRSAARHRDPERPRLLIRCSLPGALGSRSLGPRRLAPGSAGPARPPCLQATRPVSVRWLRVRYRPVRSPSAARAFPSSVRRPRCCAPAPKRLALVIREDAGERRHRHRPFRPGAESSRVVDHAGLAWVIASRRTVPRPKTWPAAPATSVRNRSRSGSEPSGPAASGVR